jgi:hypothetical protein
MMFLLDDTRQRYRDTLKAMESKKSERLGDTWDKAALGFFFGDTDRAILSVRNTLAPMLLADRRTLSHELQNELFDSITLDQSAGETAKQIHSAYIISKPLD